LTEKEEKEEALKGEGRMKKLVSFIFALDFRASDTIQKRG
jgi:hypothetical protein